MAVCWSAELCHDLWVNQTYRAVVALVVLGLLVWCYWLGRLWRVWSSVEEPLQLHWTGGPYEQAHWRIVEWSQPVKIRVACDFQDWVLLHVTSLPSHKQDFLSMWSWVAGDGYSDSGLATFHRLRALVYQARQPSVSADDRELASPIIHDSLGQRLKRIVLFRGALDSKRLPLRHQRVEPWPSTEFLPTQMLPPDVSDQAVSVAHLREGR